METYTFLREFADSWHMLFMLLFFLGVIVWVMFGNSKSYRDTAESIFRHEDSPVDNTDTREQGGVEKGKEARK